MPMLVKNAFTAVQALFVQIGAVVAHPDTTAPTKLFGQALNTFLTTLLPVALGLMLVGVIASASQGGVHFAAKALKPSFKRLNPLNGVKRMFGGQGLWEALKALMKTIALGAVIYVSSSRAKELVSAAGALPLSTVTSTFASCVVLLMRVTAITGLTIALGDYLIVRRRTMKNLRMSRYEIQQENKQTEGDPHMKSHRRSRAIAMSRNRMMAAVATADVLIVNPTHVAVALKYEAARGAPRVVAKGADEVARKLREKAEEARVPMVQDIPLARALYASCDLEQEVPPQLFTAVARVLAFVMHLGARGVRGGFHRPGFTAPDVTDLPKAGRRRNQPARAA
jgi:flagellar biosynthetic protein FlhB